MLIIDGQQRLTTVYILLKALYDVAKGVSVRIETEIEEVMFNRNCDEKYKLKLKPVKSDNEQLILLIQDKIDDMDISVVREMSNITTAAYVNSIAAMTQMFINIQPPDSYCDNVSALVSIPAEKLSRSYDEPVLYIDEKLHIGDTEINSGLILVLDSESIQILLKKLGMPYL